MTTTSSAPSVLVILDGLGDRPHPETGGISPVEAAATPNLDRWMGAGDSGSVNLLGPGVAPESDAGVLALLGYDPVKDSPGRGVLEALGVEIPLAPGDIALRLNFATADGEGTILDSRVGRTLTTAEASALARALTQADLLKPEGMRAEVRATVGHRGVLWLHPTEGGPLSPEVSNSDPFYERQGGMGRAVKVEHPMLRPVRATAETPEARRTADGIQRFMERVGGVLLGDRVNAKRAMAGKPLASTVLLRNAGALPDPPPASFSAKYGIDGAAVTEMPVERGIARLLGLRDLFVGPMGPDRDASLRERARVTRSAMEQSSFTYVHLKGPDEPGHDGRAAQKREIIEALDRSFFGPFGTGLDLASARVAVTADHATPCVLKAHSDDAVPLLLVGRGIAPGPPAPGGAPKFSEAGCARGRLGVLPSRELLPRLLG